MMEYEELIAEMKDFIDEHQLDEVSVKSLLQSSIEFLEPEVNAANVAIIHTGDLSELRSIRFKNIKINIKFALSTIFSVKPILTEEGLWLILSILRVVVQVVADMSVKLDRSEATVLFALYRLQSATEQEIEKYIDILKKEESLVEYCYRNNFCQKLIEDFLDLKGK